MSRSSKKQSITTCEDGGLNPLATARKPDEHEK